MDETAHGIIVRLRPLTETSLIVEWITQDQGRVATVAKGARRQKSAFRGKLDLFYLEDFSFQRSARSELHALKEVKLILSHDAFRSDHLKLQQAAYAVGLVELVTEKESPIPEYFEQLASYFSFLQAASPQAKNTLAFELKTVELLGIFPDL